LRVTPDVDAALDFYNDLVRFVRGRLRTSRGASELNAVLHDLLSRGWLDGDDTGRLHAKFVLRENAPRVDGKQLEWLDCSTSPTPNRTRTFRLRQVLITPSASVPLPPVVIEGCGVSCPPAHRHDRRLRQAHPAR
jgi:hypothetical protein